MSWPREDSLVHLVSLTCHMQREPWKWSSNSGKDILSMLGTIIEGCCAMLHHSCCLGGKEPWLLHHADAALTLLEAPWKI